MNRQLRMAMPWAGLIAAGLGWALTHQIGSDGNFFDCDRAGAPLLIIVILACAALAAGGALASWRVWQRRDTEGSANGFIALVSIMAAGVFLFAILLPMIAALLIPRCFG